MSSELLAFSENTIRAALALPAEAPKTPECPDAAVWPGIVARATSPATAAKLVDHAVTCAHCGPILRLAARAASRRAALNRRLCIAAVVVGGLCFTPFALSRFRLYRAESLLAKAETVDRPSQFRLSGAPYAPVRFTRSGANQDDIPAVLLQAAADASKAPKSTEAGILEARIALDSRETTDAVTAIREAIRVKGKTPALLNDLGVALATHGIAVRDDSQLDEALQAFNEALGRQPGYSEAAFNRALVLSYLGNRTEACRTPADPDPRWRSDLQSRLNCH